MDAPITTDPKAAHVLIVDDDTAIRYSISKALQRVGYQISAASSGEEALAMLEEQSFDVVLTDIRMPTLSGVELLAKIKERAPDSIVILMTAFASLGTAVESLRLGAHDYLIKPISSPDIRQSVARGLERAQNLRRRRALLEAIKSNVRELTDEEAESAPGLSLNGNGSNPPVQPPVTTMTLGPLTIFPGRYQIQVGSEHLSLTPTEFDLLLYLAAHRGRVVPCFELVREVRGYTVDEAEAREVIRPHISNLRRKLEKAGQDPDLIVNVRGVGYRLSEPGAVTT
jgi:DNA-binding response OmpR family regulator